MPDWHDITGNVFIGTPGAIQTSGAIPVPTPSEQPTGSIKLTAKNQGYYILTKDGVKVSQHTQEREAIESGAEIKRANPDSVVEYRHDYVVSVELKNG